MDDFLTALKEALKRGGGIRRCYTRDGKEDGREHPLQSFFSSLTLIMTIMANWR